MFVIKRDGRPEQVHFDKITSRISRLCYGLNSEFVDPVIISQKVCQGVYKGVTTSELDELAAETAAHHTSTHPDFGLLAARIAISNLHKETLKSFSATAKRLYEYIEPRTGLPAPMLATDVYRFIEENSAVLDSAIVYDRDFMYDYFGFKTLQYSYLLKINGKVVERPQHLLMRVACGIHCGDLDAVIETYNLLSCKWFTHATPTLFNAGTFRPQLSSCFLLSMFDDSIEGIYDTLKACAMISKQAGGIGVSVSNIRASGSYIRGTNGTSNGLVPMLRAFNATARYVDQCFAPETIVYSNHGPKFIKDVTISDKLLTATGKFEAVEQLLRHEFTGDVLEVHLAQALEPVKVTNEHQIMAVKNNPKTTDVEILRARLEKGFAVPEMYDAKDLEEGDYVCFPIPDVSTVNDIPALSIDDCRFYGLLVGAGWIGKELTRNVSGVRVPADADMLQRFIREYCADRAILFNESESDSTVEFTWVTNTVGFKFNRKQLYDESDSKAIDVHFYNLPNDKLLAILKGILEADSILLQSDVSNNQKKNVVQGIQWMLLRVGVLARYESNSLRIPSVPELCELVSTSNEGETSPYFVYNGAVYSRIHTISQVKHDGTLYDFEVSNEHTYVTSMGACHNGGGKRKGAFAIYIEPWHPDIMDFLDLRKNHGNEEKRARDLFYGLWIPDIFMKRVRDNGQWSLFCPNEAPGLCDSWGEKFEKLYEEYEKVPGKARKVIPARTLWQSILEAQQETGTPYMLYKDACNAKSNQQNLGTIRCSNLCTEVVEYTSPEEIAVCNLASIALPMYVTKEGTFDFKRLYDVTKVATRNLNKVIDVNYYPMPQARYANMRNRPIGLGVQGLADTFILMRYPFDSPEARQLNRDIFETIYFAAMSSSNELAKELGPYTTYEGSPISQGKFQFDLWNQSPPADSRWDWEGLRESILQYGVRNSLLVAPMPTASTSQILGNNESIEPYTSNIYVRRTLAGEFVCISRHLLRDLIDRKLWTPELKNKIIANGGSVQSIPEIDDDLKALYRTVWEIPQKHIIDMAIDRGVYIDQSQSLNVHMSDIRPAKLTSMHFHAWSNGLKTGMYYLRSQPASHAIQFTIDPTLIKNEMKKDEAAKKSSNNKLRVAADSPKESSASAFFSSELTPKKPEMAVTSTPVPAIVESVKSEMIVPPLISTRSNSGDGSSSDETDILAWRGQREKNREAMECSLKNPGACLSCGS